MIDKPSISKSEFTDPQGSIEKKAILKSPKKRRKMIRKFTGLDFPKKLASIVCFYIFAA